MSELKLLQARVGRLIRSKSKMRNKPPFTNAEMVVMALSLKPEQTKKAVQKWILDTFEYYKNLAFDEYLNTPGGRSSEGGGWDWRRAIESAFDQFEIPVEPRVSYAHRKSPTYWTISSAAEASIFLKQHLHNDDGSHDSEKDNHRDNSEPFPFMRLPAELRVSIYELVLRFPKSGVSITKGRSSLAVAKVSVTSRDYAQPADPLNDNFFIEAARPLSTYLAIFGVSKQVYQEAMPVFYSINNFRCGDIPALYTFLSYTPEPQQKHIHHITFELKHHYYKTAAAKSFMALKSLPNLRHLDILLRFGESFATILDIPGMRTLRGIRGLQRVTFHGNCDELRNTVAPLMVRPKPQPKPKISSKKRKAKTEPQPQPQKLPKKATKG